MYQDEHVAAWTRIVDFVHRNTEAKICLQLGHSGPKGSTQLGWEGMDEPLDEGNWPVIGPSAVPWSPQNQVPRPMTRADMDEVLRRVRARDRDGASECGFDMVELHCAHGYLLSAFITPADQPAHRRVRRQPREPAALPARGVRGDARRVARAQADVGAHLGDRLGRGRHHRRGCGRDRARPSRPRAPT